MNASVEQAAKATVTDEVQGHGEWIEPAAARASVIFVHGCGSARHSPHDRALAQFLVEMITPRCCWTSFRRRSRPPTSRAARIAAT